MKHPKLHHCEWFANSMKNIGEKGFSVIALREGERRCFYLEARPFERDVVERYSTVDPNSKTVKWPSLEDSNGRPAPYVTAMVARLRFCPACGADLDRNVRENQEEFDTLAASMGKLHPEGGWNP